MTKLTREQLGELSQTEPEPYGETQVVRVYYSDWQIIVAQARRALELEERIKTRIRELDRFADSQPAYSWDFALKQLEELLEKE